MPLAAFESASIERATCVAARKPIVPSGSATDLLVDMQSVMCGTINYCSLHQFNQPMVEKCSSSVTPPECRKAVVVDCKQRILSEHTFEN